MHCKPIRRRANMRRVGLVIGTVALLAAACGAFAQTTFTWQGSCGTQGWYDICAIGPCENNNAYTLRQNNWGSVRCSSDGSPAFPGSGDTAIIPSGFTVRINGSVTVGRIVVQPGATLIWASGNLNVGELVNEGTLEWANGDYGILVAQWSIGALGARRRRIGAAEQRHLAQRGKRRAGVAAGFD
jgi:hypothetical protein